MFKILTLMFLIWGMTKAAPTTATEIPTDCQGKFDVDFDKTYMAKHSSQTVRYMTATLADDEAKSLTISVLVRGKDDDWIYSDTYDCVDKLCTGKGEKTPSLQITETLGHLTVQLITSVVLMDEEHGENITLSNSPGANDIFQLNQLTDEDECS